MFSGSGRRLAALAACAPLVLVGACSDDPADGANADPTPSDSGSAPSSPSESPSSTPTKKYPEDKSSKSISAERVARIWATEYGRAMLSGDTQRIRAIGLKSCWQCSEYANQIEDVYAAGGNMKTRGTPRKLGKAEMVDLPSKNRIVLEFPVVASAGVTLSSEGADPVSYETKKFTWVFDLAVVEGKWRIREMGLAE